MKFNLQDALKMYPNRPPNEGQTPPMSLDALGVINNYDPRSAPSNLTQPSMPSSRWWENLSAQPAASNPQPLTMPGQGPQQMPSASTQAAQQNMPPAQNSAMQMFNRFSNMQGNAPFSGYGFNRLYGGVQSPFMGGGMSPYGGYGMSPYGGYGGVNPFLGGGFNRSPYGGMSQFGGYGMSPYGGFGMQPQFGGFGAPQYGGFNMQPQFGNQFSLMY